MHLNRIQSGFDVLSQINSLRADIQASFAASDFFFKSDFLVSRLKR